MPTFLHVGCGGKRKAQTTRGFAASEWIEIRFDVDPAVKPDILGSMLDMSGIADASVDAVYSSHNLEHLQAHEVPRALREFLRVLRPEGFLVITCPDLQAIAALVADDKLTETIYHSPAGPITPLDVLYGFGPALAAGNQYMAHRTGFTLRTLIAALRQSGFSSAIGYRQPANAYALWGIATKQTQPEPSLRALAAEHFPR